MITLYGFGPAFGLPDPSPFVVKSQVQLKMAGIPYRFERARPQDGPKGKIPFIQVGAHRLGDSNFIRKHIEEHHGFDFDNRLSTAERAEAWILERMIEDHLYFVLLHFRWMDDVNFEAGPAHFFDGAPEGVREAGRERVREYLHGQGIGRHSHDEIAGLGARSLAALSNVLGDKPFFMGETPSGVDASAFGMLSGLLTSHFTGEVRRQAERHDNLVAYADRMMASYYPGFVWGTQARAA
jgi:glutathione S-transferase